MVKMVNVRMDNRMRNALKRISEKQFSSMGAVIKQAVEKFLEDQGIDWRNEPEKPKKK